MDNTNRPYITIRAAFMIWKENELERINSRQWLFINQNKYWDNASKRIENGNYKIKEKDFVYSGKDLYEFADFIKLLFTEPNLKTIIENEEYNDLPEIMKTYPEKKLLSKFRDMYHEIINYTENTLNCQLI